MKILPLLLLPFVFFAASLTARSQDASQQAISQLQQEIAKREALDRDESIPADLKAQNRSVLDKRRGELVTAIQARITALQKYIESLGSSATAEEKEYVQNSLKNLSTATNTITGGAPAATNRTAALPATNETAALAMPQPINPSNETPRNTLLMSTANPQPAKVKIQGDSCCPK